MGQCGTVDSHGRSHLSYMVQWDRTDNRIWWARVGQWIPMDSPTCPMVQWDILLCTMDSDGKLGHPSELRNKMISFVRMCQMRM